MRAWEGEGLAVAVSADRVLLSSEAAGLVLRLLTAAERSARRDGIALSPAMERLREVLRLVADNGPRDGHADVRIQPALRASECVGARQVAEALGCTDRHARRLIAAGSLGAARKVGRSRVVSKAEVAAYATTREDRPA